MISLSASVSARLDALTLERPHEEFGGLLAGELLAGDRYRAASLLLSPERRPWGVFWITPLEFEVATRMAALRGEVPIAVVHCHPSGSLRPSMDDLRSIQAGRLPWVIAARRRGSLRFAAYAPGSAAAETVVAEPFGDSPHRS